MAVLYLARTSGLGGFERLFAIKMIHEHLGKEPGFVRMFLDEARLVARIRHPNVIPVYDVDVDESRYYISMDYVSGETLGAALTHTWPQGKSFPLDIAAYIVAMACEGLHAAHELRSSSGTLLGVIHRDISPQNIMLGYDGTIRVMDFGVAKALDQLTQSRPGAFKGTPAYMSPEHIRGQSMDRRSDIFGLGVVLWESTIGKRLFKDKTDIGTAARVLKMQIPMPSTLRAGYPKRLEKIVMRALSRDPSERHQTARELAEDLQEFLARNARRVSAGDLERFMGETFPKRRVERAELERKAALPSPGSLNLPPTEEATTLSPVTVDGPIDIDIELRESFPPIDDEPTQLAPNKQEVVKAKDLELKPSAFKSIPPKAIESANPIPLPGRRSNAPQPSLSGGAVPTGMVDVGTGLVLMGKQLPPDQETAEMPKPPPPADTVPLKKPSAPPPKDELLEALKASENDTDDVPTIRGMHRSPSEVLVVPVGAPTPLPQFGENVVTARTEVTMLVRERKSAPPGSLPLVVDPSSGLGNAAAFKKKDRRPLAAVAGVAVVIGLVGLIWSLGGSRDAPLEIAPRAEATVPVMNIQNPSDEAAEEEEVPPAAEEEPEAAAVVPAPAPAAAVVPAPAPPTPVEAPEITEPHTAEPAPLARGGAAEQQPKKKKAKPAPKKRKGTTKSWKKPSSSALFSGSDL
jgi:eukaryotic-like serine/threonine-protein kinase